MTNTDKIRWAAIQPLTGGMYLGAEKAIGHPAEFILSFKGLGDAKYDKEGNFVSCSNEYHLMKYLDSVGRRPEYKIIDKKMFEDSQDINPPIINSQWTLNPDKELDFKGLDVVVAVPVCSGLSTATRGNEDTLWEKNCNMIWICRYVLGTIKPHMYIFENAPTFMSDRGEPVRMAIEDIARANGYSIAYYKTDTLYHDNCQSRKRTFIIFYDKKYCPDMAYEHKQAELKEYFDRIPKDAPQNEPIDIFRINPVTGWFPIRYCKEKLGEDWKEIVGHNVFQWIVKNNKVEDMKQFIADSDVDDKLKDRSLKWFDHFDRKTKMGMGVYASLPYIPITHTPAVMFKSMVSLINPWEDRFCSIREFLHLMGMPHDFILQGDYIKQFAQIGQNVPARTAYWIVKNAIESYDGPCSNEKQIRFFNNIKEKEEVYVP